MESPTHDSQMLLRHCFLLTSKVHLWRGSQHLPEHFNKGAHAVVTNCNGRLRYRFALGNHFKRSEQPCLLSPTAKRHTHLSEKRTHETAAGHTSKMRPARMRIKGRTMATMKAAVIQKQGAGGSQIEASRSPRQQSGEVLIRVKAFGLNRSETVHAAGPVARA